MKIEPKHHKAIDLLITGSSINLIAKELNVRRETISIWKNDFDFQAQLNKALKANSEAAQERLRHLSGIALETIEKIMKDTDSPAKDRLTAAVKILDITQLSIGEIGSTNPDILQKEQQQNDLLDAYML